MMSLLVAPHNSRFAAAFVLLLCFALLEGISLILGLDISGFLSDLPGLPDGTEPAPDTSAETESGVAIGNALGSANPTEATDEI